MSQGAVDFSNGKFNTINRTSRTATQSTIINRAAKPANDRPPFLLNGWQLRRDELKRMWAVEEFQNRSGLISPKIVRPLAMARCSSTVCWMPATLTCDLFRNRRRARASKVRREPARRPKTGSPCSFAELILEFAINPRTSYSALREFFLC